MMIVMILILILNHYQEVFHDDVDNNEDNKMMTDNDLDES